MLQQGRGHLRKATRGHHHLFNSNFYSITAASSYRSAIRSLSSTTSKKTTFLDSLPKVFGELTHDETERQNKKHKTRSEILIDCFQIYKKMNGDMLVPTSFVIPDKDEAWPEETWGLRLGNTAISTRNGQNYKYMRDELINIGFNFNAQRVTNGYTLVKMALIRYKEINGDMLVPAVFVIPDKCPKWRDETWGMRLGAAVNSTRGGRTFKDKREELISLGFDYNPQCITYGYDLLKAALIRYKELNGDMRVPQYFVVPELSGEFPQPMWGMRLGACVGSIRHKKSFKEHREELTGLGFDYATQTIAHGYDLVKMALLQYKAHHGHLLVPFVYIIPDKSSKWPEETWGMRLGDAVSSIRCGKSYKDNRDELTLMGFDFNPQKKVYGYELVKQAILQYKELHGHLKVPYTFIVKKDNLQYPERTWGMNLGGAVKAIRCGTRYRKKRADLISIGIVIPVFDTLIEDRDSAIIVEKDKLIGKLKEERDEKKEKKVKNEKKVKKEIGAITDRITGTKAITISEPIGYFKRLAVP